jgi:cell division transport system permease protein
MNQRKLITFGRIIKNGAQGFIRNASLSVAAVAVMVITLTIVLFSLIANSTFSHTIAQITDKIDISIYLKDDITEPQRQELVSDLENVGNVRSVAYVSKEEARKNFSQDNPEQLSALVQIDNPLPASLRVKPRDPNKIEDIRTFIETAEVKQLQSAPTSYSGERKEAIDKITKATTFFRQAGIVGMVIFTIVSMLIIFNTIRMTIFNRRDELQIMRLLGASTVYIRGPFIVETILYGVIAAFLSVILCSALFQVASSTIEATTVGVLDIKFASDYFENRFWLILTVQLLIGMLIGAVSSYIATRRYLKFKTSK